MSEYWNKRKGDFKELAIIIIVVTIIVILRSNSADFARSFDPIFDFVNQHFWLFSILACIIYLIGGRIWDKIKMNRIKEDPFKEKYLENLNSQNKQQFEEKYFDHFD